MANNQLPSFMGGLMQGYGFVDNLKRRDKQEELQQEQWKFQQEQAALANTRADEHLGIAKEQAARQQAEYETTQRKRKLSEGIYKLQQRVPLTPEEIEEYSSYGAPIKHIGNPEFLASAKRLEESFSQGNFLTPDTIVAMNTVYADRLEKGIGEAIPAKYGKGKIVGKQIADIIPGTDSSGEILDKDGDGLPDTVAVELAVSYEREDGTTGTYRAPMTKGRSASEDDDEVAQIPLKTWLSDFKGRSMLAQAVHSDEGLLNTLRASLVGAGGDPEALKPKGKYGKAYEDPKFGLLQDGPDGETRRIAGFDQYGSGAGGAGGVGRGGKPTYKTGPDGVIYAVYGAEAVPVITGPSDEERRAAAVQQTGRSLVFQDTADAYAATPGRQPLREQTDQSQAQIKYNELRQQNVPDEIARGVAYGTYREVRNPATGSTTIIDVARNAEVGSYQPLDPDDPFNSPMQWVPARSAAPAQAGAAGLLPAAEAAAPPVSKLREGKAITFANGQTWTLVNGRPVQVK